MRRKIWTLAFLVALVPAMAMAQPPEELPAEGVDENLPVIEEDFQSVEPAPVAEPLAAPIPAPQPAPTAAPEDNTVRGVTLSPGLGIFPIGFDNQNITGEEGGRYFILIRPSIALESLFKTAGGKTLTFSASYNLYYREYFNKGPTLRDFENEADGSLAIDWTDRVSMDFYGYLDVFTKSGTDDSGDNALYVATDAPRMAFKAMDNLTLTLGLWTQFFEALDGPLSASDINPPGDLDDIRRGDITQSADTYLGFDNAYFPGAYASSLPSSEEFLWGANLAIRPVVSWKATPSTSVKMDYKYVFEGYSNLQSQEWRGHYIKPSISQKMPWPGGSISVSDELRLRVYKSATVSGGPAVQNFRNRLTIALNQSITDFMSWMAYYRWETTGKNADDYAKIDHAHWMFTGIELSF